MPSNTKKSVVMIFAIEKPLWKNTVCAIERIAVPIRPTTAGLRPVIQPDTILLLLNFSKNLATIRIIIKDGRTTPRVAQKAPKIPSKTPCSLPRVFPI